MPFSSKTPQNDASSQLGITIISAKVFFLLTQVLILYNKFLIDPPSQKEGMRHDTLVER